MDGIKKWLIAGVATAALGAGVVGIGTAMTSAQEASPSPSTPAPEETAPDEQKSEKDCPHDSADGATGQTRGMHRGNGTAGA